MEDHRIDSLARSVAKGGLDRRRLLLSIGGATALLGSRVDKAAAKDNNPGNGNGNGGGKDKEKEKDKPDRNGNDKSKGIKEKTPVIPLPSCLIETSCSYDAEANESTCTCSGAMEESVTTLRSISVSSAAVCLDVLTPESDSTHVSMPGFSSPDGVPSLSLRIAGEVSTGGTANYWCTTDLGIIPAKGPGLVRLEGDISDSTGSIDVHVSSCAVTAPGPTAFDLHGECLNSSGGKSLLLTPVDDAEKNQPLSGRTGSGGCFTFGKLLPGRYSLDPDGFIWCRAESDDVDSNGDVVVKAGQRTAVWLFICSTS